MTWERRSRPSITFRRGVVLVLVCVEEWLESVQRFLTVVQWNSFYFYLHFGNYITYVETHTQFFKLLLK